MSTLRIAAPVSLGRLLTTEMIRAEFFGHLPHPPSLRWVAAQLPMGKRTRIGRTFGWWEADVITALSALRGAA